MTIAELISVGRQAGERGANSAHEMLAMIDLAPVDRAFATLLASQLLTVATEVWERQLAYQPINPSAVSAALAAALAACERIDADIKREMEGETNV